MVGVADWHGQIHSSNDDCRPNHPPVGSHHTHTSCNPLKRTPTTVPQEVLQPVPLEFKIAPHTFPSIVVLAEMIPTVRVVMMLLFHCSDL